MTEVRSYTPPLTPPLAPPTCPNMVSSGSKDSKMVTSWSHVSYLEAKVWWTSCPHWFIHFTTCAGPNSFKKTHWGFGTESSENIRDTFQIPSLHSLLFARRPSWGVAVQLGGRSLCQMWERHVSAAPTRRRKEIWDRSRGARRRWRWRCRRRAERETKST